MSAVSASAVSPRAPAALADPASSASLDDEQVSEPYAISEVSYQVVSLATDLNIPAILRLVEQLDVKTNPSTALRLLNKWLADLKQRKVEQKTARSSYVDTLDLSDVDRPKKNYFCSSFFYWRWNMEIVHENALQMV